MGRRSRSGLSWRVMSVALAAAGGAAAGLRVPLPAWLALAAGGVATLFAAVLIDKRTGSRDEADATGLARRRLRFRVMWRVVGVTLAAAGAAAGALRLPLPTWLPLALGGVASLAASVVIDRMERARDAEAEALRARGEALRPLRAVSLVRGTGRLALLSAERSVASFRGRSASLADLCAWRDGDGSPLLLLGGQAGTGKSRLALEFASRSEGTGWHAGWLQPGKGAATIAAVTACGDPAVILIDDADERADDVELLLGALTRHEGKPAIRVILISRSAAGLGDWLTGRLADASASLVADALHLELGQEGSPEDRKRWLREAAASYAAALGSPAPVLPDTDLAGWGAESFLMLQATALVAAGRGGDGDTQPAGTGAVTLSPGLVLRTLMDHERRRWRAVEPAWGVPGTDSIGLHSALQRVQARAIVALALLGAVGASEAETVLRRVPELRDESAMRLAQVAVAVASLYPDGPAGAPRIVPDAVGEWFVVSELAADPGLAVALRTAITSEETARALAFLARAADSLAATGSADLLAACGALFGEFAAGDLDRVVAAAMLAARTGHQAGPLLDENVGRLLPPSTDWDLDTLMALDERLRDTNLSHTKAGVCERLVELLRAAAANDVAGDPGAAPVPDAELKLAWALSGLSVNLRETGRTEEALKAAREAVSISRRVAEEGTSQDDIRQSALRYLIGVLGDVDRPDEMVAACRERVMLLRDGTGPMPFRNFWVAEALAALAGGLCRAGRWQEALDAGVEAVSWCEALLDAGPAGRPDEPLGVERVLALGLSQVSMASGKLGDTAAELGAAERAVGLLRTLLAHDQGVLYRLRLAEALGNLAAARARMRQPGALDASEESVRLARELADADPVAAQRLAVELVNLSVHLWHAGRPAEAVTAARQGVARWRAIAVADDRFNGDLANALLHLASRLGDGGQRREALVPLRESIALLRPLAAREQAWRPEFAHALQLLVADLAMSHQYTEALEVADEALAAYESIPGDDTEAGESVLRREGGHASVLVNRAASLDELGRHDEALPSRLAGVRKLATLAARDPASFQGYYNDQLRRLTRAYGSRGLSVPDFGVLAAPEAGT